MGGVSRTRSDVWAAAMQASTASAMRARTALTRQGWAEQSMGRGSCTHNRKDAVSNISTNNNHTSTVRATTSSGPPTRMAHSISKTDQTRGWWTAAGSCKGETHNITSNRWWWRCVGQQNEALDVNSNFNGSNNTNNREEKGGMRKQMTLLVEEE